MSRFEYETVQSEVQVIQSRNLAAKTIAKLGLDKDPEFNAALRPSHESRPQT